MGALMGGGLPSPPAPPSPSSNNALTGTAAMLAEIRARQERTRRGTGSLVIQPTTTVPQETGLRIPT